MTRNRATADVVSAQLASEMRSNRPSWRKSAFSPHKPTPYLALVFGFRSHRLARLAWRVAEAIRGRFRLGMRTWRGQAERQTSGSGLSVAAGSRPAADGPSVDVS